MTKMDLPHPSPDQIVRVDGVEKAFVNRNGQLAPALGTTSLYANRSEFVSVLGPSGCGKSTLFHIVAGLLEPGAGTVTVDGDVVNGSRGHVAYMPQGDQLLPWRSILDNVTLGLEVDGVSRREARQLGLELLSRFGLGEYVNAAPHQLSGGMRQRAAFIRTMLFPRNVLLLDEPLGALDAQTRLLMQEWLLEAWAAQHKTVLLITHDVDEAVFLSDRVYVMSARPGQIIGNVAVDLPRPRDPELRESPEYVALVRELLHLVRSETIKSFEQSAEDAA